MIQVEGFGQLHMLDIDAAKRVVGLDVNRDEHGDGDDRDLHHFAQAEPEDEQGNERQRRDRPLHLDDAVQDVAAQQAHPGRQRQHDPEDGTDHQSLAGPQRRDHEVGLEPTLTDQVQARRDRNPGGRQDSRIDDPGRRPHRPVDHQQQRTEEPAVGDGFAEPEPPPSGRRCA